MIAIRGMEMPKKCSECPMYEQSGIDVYCCADYVGIDNPFKKRDNCPLVEIITCQDCKHCYPDEDGRGYHCERDNNVRVSVHRDFWCSDGKRRE